LDQHIVYVPFYMPGEHPKFADADEVFVQKVKRYLQKINPALQDSDFLDVRASRYRYAIEKIRTTLTHLESVR
jgi:protoporphyrinogen oxidase